MRRSFSSPASLNPLPPLFLCRHVTLHSNAHALSYLHMLCCAVPAQVHDGACLV